MIRAGREMEVIVPRDGTLTFGVGLAANEMPAFFDGLDEALVRAGLRTQNGADETLYPEASAYESAAPLPDGAHFARVTQRIGAISGASGIVRVFLLRRTGWSIRFSARRSAFC